MTGISIDDRTPPPVAPSASPVIRDYTDLGTKRKGDLR